MYFYKDGYAVRAIHPRPKRRGFSRKSGKKCHYFLTGASIAIGLTWGSFALLFFPADPDIQILLVCVLLGLMAGAIATNTVHPPSLHGYSLGIMLPLFLAHLYYGQQNHAMYFSNENNHHILSLMLCIMVLLLSMIGRQVARKYEHSLQSLFIQQDLSHRLSQQNEANQQALQQLHRSNQKLHHYEIQLKQVLSVQHSLIKERDSEIERLRESAIFALSSLATPTSC